MRILSMTAVMLFGLFNVSHAVASDCSPAPVEVTSQMSGTLSSLASLRGMVQSSYNRLERKWRVAATGKYGPAYKHMARGTCTCAIQNKEFVAGERVAFTCELSAQACDHAYVYMSDFRCEFQQASTENER